MLDGYEIAKMAVKQSIDGGGEIKNSGVSIRKYNVIVRKYFVQTRTFECIYDDFTEAWGVFVDLVVKKAQTNG